MSNVLTPLTIVMSVTQRHAGLYPSPLSLNTLHRSSGRHQLSLRRACTPASTGCLAEAAAAVSRASGDRRPYLSTSR